MQTILVEARNAPEQDEAFVARLQAWEVKKFDQPVYAYFALLNRRRRSYRYVACFSFAEVETFRRSARDFGLVTHRRSIFGMLWTFIGMRAPLSFPATSRPDIQGEAEVIALNRQPEPR